jgi:hypothetical protein
MRPSGSIESATRISIGEDDLIPGLQAFETWLKDFASASRNTCYEPVFIDAVVQARQACLGDLEIELGLALGVVPGRDKLAGFFLVGGLQVVAFAGGFIHAVIHPSANAADD